MVDFFSKDDEIIQFVSFPLSTNMMHSQIENHGKSVLLTPLQLLKHHNSLRRSDHWYLQFTNEQSRKVKDGAGMVAQVVRRLPCTC